MLNILKTSLVRWLAARKRSRAMLLRRAGIVRNQTRQRG